MVTAAIVTLLFFAGAGLADWVAPHTPFDPGTLDLSDAEQPRDLSLTPELIDWVEEHFGLEKLEADYPHWNDARPATKASPAP